MADIGETGYISSMPLHELAAILLVMCMK
jgi:hypothetical protein